MKRALSIFLALVMLLSLCACGKDGAQNTDPVTNSSQTATDGTEEPTEGETEGTQAPADDPTTAPTEESTDTPTEAPTEAPTTCSHSWKDATCTAAKTCSKCGVTEGKAAGHSWKKATCTAPKTCSKCGATEGKKADHSYQNGACTGCGAAEPAAAVDGKWFLEGINNDGVEYETMELTLSEGKVNIDIAYFGKLYYDSPEMLEAILKDGYYGDDDGGMYYYDIRQYNGVYYHSAMYGTFGKGTYTVSGNTVTIEIAEYGDGPKGTWVLTKTADNTLKIVSIDDQVFDEIVREVLNNGRIFKKIG